MQHNMKDWSCKLVEKVWVYRMVWKTNLDMSLYHLIFDNACHLPVEFEHKAYCCRPNITPLL